MSTALSTNKIRLILTKRQPLKSNEAFWIAIAVFLLPMLFIVYDVLQFTGGAFSYPVDDTFIHLTIAKNLAYYHVWGISPHGFVSASSSVLYPLILMAAIKVFGFHAVIPFILNLLAGILLVWIMQRWLMSQQLTPITQLTVLLTVILLTPLPIIVLSGMEHTLQILFCFLFITRFSQEMEQQAASKTKWTFSWTVYLYGLLLTATRYESIMLIGIACLVLFVRRQWTPAFQLVIISFSPILIFGFYSIYQGSYFIPNSVLMKSGAPALTFDELYQFFSSKVFSRLSLSTSSYNTAACQRLLLILPACYLLFHTQIYKNRTFHYLLILLFGTAILHLILTGKGRFPRYEAYLIGNGVVVAGALFAKYGREVFRKMVPGKRWLISIIALLLLVPITMRSVDAFSIVDRASINIYQQQYQMGRFLGKYYHDTPIALNDIGAVSYFTEGNNLDLIGLGSLDVLRSRKEHYSTPEFLNGLIRHNGVDVAVITEHAFPPELLQGWNKVASWEITTENVICLDDSISFYAIKSEAIQGLKKNLHDFEHLLPKGVAARYY